MPAFTNEKDLKNLLQSRLSTGPLNPVKFRVDKYKVEAGVDFSLEHKNLTYLFKIDSYNHPKILFAEYLLINQHISNSEAYKLIAIQYAKGYNINRSIQHLNYAQNKMGCRLAFKVFDGISFEALVKQARSLNGFIKLIEDFNVLNYKKG